jgi:iron complex outermembrane receptor protein
MRLVPGMYVGFADGNRPVVSAHGATDEYSRRMQVLIDGRSVYLPPFGSVGWADLPVLLDDIERIEVVRGPAAASHGVNSFYGVINIITREAVGHEGGRAVLSAGGGVTDAMASMAQSGELMDAKISAGYRSDTGLNPALNDHNSTRVVNLRTNYHPTVSDNFEVQLGAANGAYGLGSAPLRPEEAVRDININNDFEQLSWNHSWQNNDESKLTYYRINRDYVDPYMCLSAKPDPLCNSTSTQFDPASMVRFEMVSQRQELELQNINSTDNNRLVWGASFRQDSANSPLLIGDFSVVQYRRLFAHDEYRFNPAWVLNVGSMFESDTNGYSSNSPRASLNYHFTPQQTLRFGMSTASRMPQMTETSMSSIIIGMGNTPPILPLKPEQVFSREIAYLGEFPEVNITLDARVYYDQVRDLIWKDHFAFVGPTLAVDRSDYRDSVKNLVSADYRGLESTLKYLWSEGHSFMVANYAYQEASAYMSGDPTQAFNTNYYPDKLGPYTPAEFIRLGYPAAYINPFGDMVPKHNVSVLVSQQLNDSIQLSAGYYYRTMVRVTNVAAYTPFADGVPPESVMRRLDLRLAKIFGPHDQAGSGEVAVILQNATQDDYNQYGTVIERASQTFSRRAYLTLSVNY